MISRGMIAGLGSLGVTVDVFGPGKAPGGWAKRRSERIGPDQRARCRPIPRACPPRTLKQPHGRDFHRKTAVLATNARERWHRLQATLYVLRSDSSKSARTRARGMLRGCPPACHSGRGGGGIDSAKQTYARRPSAACSVGAPGRPASGARALLVGQVHARPVRRVDRDRL